MRQSIKILSLAAIAGAAACGAPSSLPPPRAPVATATLVRSMQPPPSIPKIQTDTVVTDSAPPAGVADDPLGAAIARPLLLDNGRPAPGNVQRKGDMD